jgi:predicted nucleotidyltransferase
MENIAEKRDPLGHVPSDVRQELNNFVKGILEYEPVTQIERIVLFGSLAEGRWKRKTSDIDVAIVTADDPRYSWAHQALDEITPEQLSLIIHGIQRIKKHEDKFEFFVCTQSDFKGIFTLFNARKGKIGEDIKNGIPLYERK